MEDILSIKQRDLEPMCFQIVEDGEELEDSNINNDESDSKLKHYIQFKKKKYTKNEVEKTLI